MSLDLSNVSIMLQLHWPANERIIEGSLFSHFSGSLFSDFSKCWEIQQWLAWQPSFYISKMSLDLSNVSTKFQFDWLANNRIIERSLFFHFSGSLFSDFSKCCEIQQWLAWQPSFYISKMSLDLNNVFTKFLLDWPANNRIIEGSLFSLFPGSFFSDFSKCWEIQQWMPWQPSFYNSKMSLEINNVSAKFQLD